MVSITVMASSSFPFGMGAEVFTGSRDAVAQSMATVVVSTRVGLVTSARP